MALAGWSTGVAAAVTAAFRRDRHRALRLLQGHRGCWREFVRLMESRGGLTGPVRYGKTFTRVHEPHLWRQAGDRLLTQPGVRLLLHALVTEVLMEGGESVVGAIGSAKQGRLDIRAKLTADAAAIGGLPTSCATTGASRARQ